jgi:hypothetical protein
MTQSLQSQVAPSETVDEKACNTVASFSVLEHREGNLGLDPVKEAVWNKEMIYTMDSIGKRR